MRVAFAVFLVGCATDDPEKPLGDGGDVGASSPTVPETGGDGGDGPVADDDGDDDGHDADVDCDDDDASVHPGADDVPYDGIDQDCVDGDRVDVDQDGFDAEQVAGDDCDDTDSEIRPDAIETWYDGIDQDCDGACDGDQDGDGSVVEGWLVADGDACDADPDAGEVLAPTDCDDTNPLAEALLVSTSPADGATDARPWRSVTATLTDADPTGVLALADAAGAPVPGTSTGSGATISFAPDAPLEPLATYTAELGWACGTATWSFTTDDGTGQDFLTRWTPGATDTLQVTVVNPVATAYGFGMAETGNSAAGWYGEDCAGARATGSCHPMGTAPLVLESVFPSVGSVVPGSTTLFDATFDAGITYYAEARGGPQVGSCWAWGHDPAYFAGCTPL